MGSATFNTGYMLEKDLWKSIIDNEDGSTKGQLCIICAQVRLGRKLKPSDFTAVPLNLRPNGILSMMFPTEFRAHMSKFVDNEDTDNEEWSKKNQKSSYGAHLLDNYVTHTS